MEEKTIDAIHRLMGELDEEKNKMKMVKQQLNDILEQNDDYRQLKEELKELTAKRAEMKKVLQDDKDYQVFSSELDELRFKLKDLQEILSHHLVNYYNETQNTQIKDNAGEVRTVIISAKVGKPEFIVASE